MMRGEGRRGQQSERQQSESQGRRGSESGDGPTDENHRMKY
jgi:hypothetical protein